MGTWRIYLSVKQCEQKEFPNFKGKIFQLCFLCLWKVKGFVKNTDFSEVRHFTHFHETPSIVYVSRTPA
jgi:hypothetical protein